MSTIQPSRKANITDGQGNQVTLDGRNGIIIQVAPGADLEILVSGGGFATINGADIDTGGGSGGVTSFNTRTGDVVPEQEDYEFLLTDATLDAGFGVTDANGAEIASTDNFFTISMGSGQAAINLAASGAVVEIVTAASHWNLFETQVQANVPFMAGQYLVANLPTGAEGMTAYATNGLKVGEITGSGTGVPVYFSNGLWRVFSTDAEVSS